MTHKQLIIAGGGAAAAYLLYKRRGALAPARPGAAAPTGSRIPAIGGGIFSTGGTRGGATSLTRAPTVVSRPTTTGGLATRAPTTATRTPQTFAEAITAGGIEGLLSYFARPKAPAPTPTRAPAPTTAPKPAGSTAGAPPGGSSGGQSSSVYRPQAPGTAFGVYDPYSDPANYDAYGNYVGEGAYDAAGNYIGPGDPTTAGIFDPNAPTPYDYEPGGREFVGPINTGDPAADYTAYEPGGDLFSGPTQDENGNWTDDPPAIGVSPYPDDFWQGPINISDPSDGAFAPDSGVDAELWQNGPDYGPVSYNDFSNVDAYAPGGDQFVGPIDSGVDGGLNDDNWNWWDY